MSTALAYGDATVSNNPDRIFFSWRRAQQALPVNNPESRTYVLTAGETRVLWSGVRGVFISADTEFTAELLITSDPLSTGFRHRLTHTGGTAPAFRPARTLTLNTKTVVVTINDNPTVTMTTVAGDWSDCEVGDTLFIPSLNSGDSASPFNDLNCGYWTVYGVTTGGAGVVLARSGVFEALAESVAITANAQVQVFGAVGLQVGDTVDISAGFSQAFLRSWKVIAVNPSWFEILSTDALPVTEEAVPGLTGMSFFSSSKRFLRLEGDQEAGVLLNGDTVDHLRLSPWRAGDQAWAGECTQVGTIWAVSVHNRAAVSLNLTCVTAE